MIIFFKKKLRQLQIGLISVPCDPGHELYWSNNFFIILLFNYMIKIDAHKN
jgi:hypothetical protein